MKIKIIKFDKKDLIERKNIIDELLKSDIGTMDFNEENLKKAKEIVSKYKKVTSDNWGNKPIEIIVVNSEDEIIANIK